MTLHATDHEYLLFLLAVSTCHNPERVMLHAAGTLLVV